MTDWDREELLQQAFAKLALLEQLVRVILREKAIENELGPSDILRWAEEQKQFFEKRMPLGSEVYQPGQLMHSSMFLPPI
jgi:hypothetical protein